MNHASDPLLPLPADLLRPTAAPSQPTRVSGPSLASAKALDASSTATPLAATSGAFSEHRPCT